MMVATPKATMASQLKKGTVQLNVLQKRGKKDQVSNRHGKANFSQTLKYYEESKKAI